MLSVLVVDRESDILGLLETILTRMGHCVEVLEYLSDSPSESETYDLIILDVASFKQEQKLLLDASTRGKLCVSSIWKESRLPPDLNVQYDYYLQKPFRLDSLKKILDSVMCLSPVPGS